MERIINSTDRLGSNEKDEREKVIHEIQSTITSLLSSVPEGCGTWIDKEFCAQIDGPGLPKTAFISRTFEEVGDEHVSGVRYEYQINLAYPVFFPDEIAEVEYEEHYYLITPDDQLLKLKIIEHDYISRPDIGTPKSMDEFVSIMGARKDDLDQMRVNLKMQLELGMNGQPVLTAEAKWIAEALKNAKVMQTGPKNA